MFGALKKLFGKSSETAPEPAAARAPASAAPSQPVPSKAPTSAAAAAAQRPAFPTTPPATKVEAADAIAIPWAVIVLKLPPDVQPLVIRTPQGDYTLSAKSAVSQLSSGAVRVPFASLRKAAPSGSFADNASQDELPIELPLAPILAAIGPSGLNRRAGQKRLDAPDDVTGVFAGKNNKGARVLSPVTPGAPAPAAAPAPVAPAPPPPPAPAPVQAAAPAPAPVAPKPAAPPPTSVKPVTPAPAAPKPVTPAPLPSAASQKPAAPLPFAAKPAAPAPPPAAPAAPKPAPLPTAAPSPAPAVAAAPASEMGLVVAPLSAISAAWPEAIRQELAQFGGVSVALPASKLDSGMKLGRIVLTWAEVRQAIQPPVGGSSPLGDTIVDLPLQVIAPLFLASRRPGGAQKKINVGENIPDLFAGLQAGAAQVAATAAPAAPAPAAPAAAAQPPPPVSHAPQPDVLGALLGQPMKSDWTPQEISQKISGLKGVAGNLLTLGDGLAVAGQMPAPLKTELVAAFIPQIYARASQRATEMQLGELKSVNLTAAAGPCLVFKAGKFYLGVLGRPTEGLPEAQLARIAAELAKRNP